MKKYLKHRIKKYSILGIKKGKKELNLGNFDISKRIIGMEFILILIVCIGLGYTSIKNSSDIIIDQTEDMLNLIAEDGADSIQSMILNNAYELEAIASSVDKNTLNQTDAIEELLRESNRYGFLDVAIVESDKTGFYLRSNNAIETGDLECIDKAFLGYPSMSPLTNDGYNNYLLYAAPIYDGEEVIAVLIGKKSVLSLNEVTDNLGLGENSFAYIFDKSGYLYAYPQREYVINRVNIFEKAETDEKFKSWGNSILQLGVGNEGVINYEFLGDKYYVGIKPIPNTDWIVGVSIEEEEVLSRLNSLKDSSVRGSVLYIIIGVVAAILMSKTISIPMKKLSKEIKKYSDYDFTIDEKSPILKYKHRKDEIGEISRSILTMHNSFVELIDRITESSQRVGQASSNLMAISQLVSASSQDVAKAVEEIANGASEQANNTEEGSLHIEKLGNSITDNDIQMGNVMELALEIDNLKEEGLNIVKDLVDKTHRSNESIDEIGRVVTNISNKTEKVVGISNMIKDIAEQTNLLALNAAIEAARAGEYGRGFAVVADEIRKLSDQSNGFAEEISNIIRELTDEIKATKDTMEMVNETLSSQTESVNMTNSKFEGIAKSIENIKELIEGINNSSKEMKDKKDEVITIMQNLASISEENAASTEEVSASIEEQTASMEEVANLSEKLANLANEMEESISVFYMQ